MSSRFEPGEADSDPRRSLLVDPGGPGMISSLEGTVAEKAGDRVVLAVGGVGYELLVPAQSLAKLPPDERVTSAPEPSSRRLGDFRGPQLTRAET